MKRLCWLIGIALLATGMPLASQVAVAPITASTPFDATAGESAANILVLGTGTGMSYDSNALSSTPHVSNIQYMLYPIIGARLTRSRWDATLSIIPGVAHSSANISQYEGVSATSTLRLGYRPSERLSLTLDNTFISSSNPFDSLITTAVPGQGPSGPSPTVAANYLPHTNELLVTEATYGLGPRTALTATGSYNYLSYQHNSNIPGVLQPFDTTIAGVGSIGISHRTSQRFQSRLQYVAEYFSAGQGLMNTLGQSPQYAFTYLPKADVQLSGMIGPEYVLNTFNIPGVSGISGRGNGAQVAGWIWVGNLAISKTAGRNRLSASAATRLNSGTQYQGTVRETSFQADIRRPLPRKTELDLFVAYNINEPVFAGQSLPRLSNNYMSAGVVGSKVIRDHWVVSGAYWYLFQDAQSSLYQQYSGDHNRVAVSLTYVITRALPR